MKAKYFKSITFLVILVMMAWACARPVAPEGGPKDPDPPALVTEKSSPNFKTNFDEKIITFEFDEWINLKNPVKNILISPPIEFGKYEVKHKGKKVIIEFDEDLELLDSVTYQINFGEAISDFTENNVLQNFRYVFSTGDELDSLKIVGTVLNGLTAEPEAEMEVYLYQDLSDTVFTKGGPFYFTSTDKFGKFEFQNIRKDSFQLYALRKNGLERKYTQPGEIVAFLDSLVILNDSITPYVELLTFAEETEQKLLNTNKKTGGMLRYKFAKTVEDVVPELELEHFVEHKKDSLLLWYKNPDKDSFQVVLPELDTSWFKYKAMDTTQSKIRLEFPQRLGKIRTNDTLIWKSMWPFESFEKDSIMLTDTVGNANIDQIWIEGNEIKITANFAEALSYDLTFNKNALVDWKGNVNDSTTIKLEIATENDFGNIQINFEEYDEAMNYIFELVSKETVLATKQFTSEIITFEDIEAGTYSLRIIEDENANGKWDTGNIEEKRQPESIFSFTLEELRVGWDIETTINLSSQ